MNSDKTSGISGVGSALAELRARAKLSLAELADKVETSKSALSKIENNERPVSLQLLERLAKPLKWRPEALILFCLQSKYRALMNPAVLAELEELETAINGD